LVRIDLLQGCTFDGFGCPNDVPNLAAPKIGDIFSRSSMVKRVLGGVLVWFKAPIKN
jgi:hypothetical protein